MGFKDAAVNDNAIHYWGFGEKVLPFHDAVGNFDVGPKMQLATDKPDGSPTGNGVKVGFTVSEQTFSWAPTSQWTIEFIFKLFSSDSFYKTLFTKGFSDGIYIKNGELNWFDGSDNFFGPIALDQWVHVAFVWDNGSVEAFLDGSSLGTKSNLSVPSELNTLFGIPKEINNAPDATLAASALFDKTLSEATLTDHRNAAFKKFQVSGNVVDESDGSELEATVRAFRWDNGSLLGETTSDPSTGDYTLGGIDYDGDWLIVMQPPSGLRPRSHGPTTPVEE